MTYPTNFMKVHQISSCEWDFMMINMADQVNDSSQILSKLQTLNLENKLSKENGNLNCDNELEKWGFPMTEVYKLAVSFYKEKEGKAIQLSYEDKLQLVAFSQQISHGPFASVVTKLPPLGAFDVVGRDRRLAWERLGNLSADQARSGFVELLNRRCALLAPHIEAHRREKEEKNRLAKAEQERKLIELEEQKRKEEEEQRLQEQLEKEEAIKRQIQQALNEQTYDQFRTYAEQQFPGEPERQGSLVRQLQEQHYFQYMQQLQASPQSETIHEPSIKAEEASSTPPGDQSPSPASLWTRSDIQAFKQAVAQAEGDGVVRVGHGETVTVRVPTHREGSRLFWEFATDHYDIGFGVYFEWGVPSTDQVSVHVSESEDDDDEMDDEGLDEEGISPSDIEAAPGLMSRPLLSEIVPVFRRDCQNEVYAGSHLYPGQGVYLLKFDNSYSLWRSKTLYYRVYYTH